MARSLYDRHNNTYFHISKKVKRIPNINHQGCNNECSTDLNKQQHDRVIKSVLCNIVLFRKIVSLGAPLKRSIKSYKINQLPNDITWYLRCGFITILKERIEREEMELKQHLEQQQDQQTSFNNRKDYLNEHHLKWNYKTTQEICLYGSQDIELFKYLFEKKPEWFGHPKCLENVALAGNQEMFDMLASNTIPVQVTFNIEEYIELLKLAYRKGYYQYEQDDIVEHIHSLICRGVNKDTDLNHHTEFIKQVLQFHLENDQYNQLVEKANQSVISLVSTVESNEILYEIEDDKEEDDEEEEEEYGDAEHDQEEEEEVERDENSTYFDTISRLSTKQSQWYLFLFNICYFGLVDGDDETYSWPTEPKHIFKVYIQNGKEKEYTGLVEKIFGCHYIVANARLEHVKAAHLLGLLDEDTVFYPRHHDAYQSLEIMQYLIDNGISEFDKTTLEVFCYKQKSIGLVELLYKRYPNLFDRSTNSIIAEYITRFGYYHLLYMIITLISDSDPSQIGENVLEVTNSKNLSQKVFDILSKVAIVQYFYDDSIGQASFQWMKQIYQNCNDPNHQEKIIDMYQTQLEMSTKLNQIDIVNYLLFQQSKFQPTKETLSSIISIAFKKQFLDLHKLINEYMVKQQQQQTNQQTTVKYEMKLLKRIATNGDIKQFDQLISNGHRMKQKVLNELFRFSIVNNQLAFIQHINDKYPNWTTMSVGNFLYWAISHDHPQMLKWLLEFSRQNGYQEGIQHALKKCIETGSLPCFKLLVDQHYSVAIPILKDQIIKCTDDNLPIISFLIDNNYIASTNLLSQSSSLKELN
ncbi:hypothetical protein DFA_08216 [Cavenderia fasciculata]|uniref:Ankyrin repeat-containing protein n=1 Tax=Cavenderia fasciculata TaxID=261658 RepID=F4Q5G7_CACFS|nr:uncharacterized protein DFA_08216 [Cavenderia fasciculata]EGG17226.1 hypothetical protein DFA_08216 [Cavenderia fasciculata]|eukprot:XP_004355710.1 hypothetical protein DFA_08216 [Cavenderia fasciculata]